MKIVVLTTFMHPHDFVFLTKAGETYNPSHQNFYASLLKGLQTHHDIDVLTFLPNRKSIREPFTNARIKKFLRMQFYYPTFINQNPFRQIVYAIRVHAFIKKQLKYHKQITLLIDGQSRWISAISFLYRHHPRLKIIAIITDHPGMLTPPSKHTKHWIRYLQFAHGYLCLTPELNRLFNPNQKPSLIRYSVTETRTTSSKHNRPYFFFSGALYTRYGIDALLEAFIGLNRPDIDLIIAGHGPEAKLIETLSQHHRNIKFKGLLTQTQVWGYQANAMVNINPRPSDPLLDTYSVPSKLIEYASSGSPTLSIEHPLLEPLFGESIAWIKDSSALAIRLALQRLLSSDYALLQQRALEAKKIALSHFDAGVVSLDLFNLIKSVQ
jgi:glycosyltransferase involved in cell wall biosynthesis